MSDEENVTRLSFQEPQRKSEQRGDGPKPQRPKSTVPQLPRTSVSAEQIVKPDQRAIACVNMKLAGAPFHDIARELDYASAAAAEQAYVSALASMYPVETWESLRQIEAMRAEQLFARSFAMASADYLVIEGDDGQEVQVPNTERRQWHEQAAKDLMMHATITGAKAPARVEISADAGEINRMVEVLVASNRGNREVEASIWDADDIPTVDAEVVED